MFNKGMTEEEMNNDPLVQVAMEIAKAALCESSTAVEELIDLLHDFSTRAIARIEARELSRKNSLN